MSGYSKLDCGIVDSSLWEMPHEYLRVWIAMLSKTDATGYVRVSPPAMARLCHLNREEFDTIIEAYCAPDPESRTEDYEGRRLAKVEGGWQILNYLKYREGLKQPDSSAGRMRKFREKRKCDGSTVTVTVGDGYAEAEAKADANAKKENPKKDSCSEPESKPSDSKPADPVVGEFPISGEPNIWYLKKSKMQEWTKVYGQQCDVRSELIKAKQWLIDNPVRRKTTKGMTRFLNTWLQNAINSNRAALPAGVTRPETPEDVQRRLGLRT